jgi:predicted GNAT family N-acyltransferase
MTNTCPIKTAETEQERQRIFRFRYEIYVKEMGKTPDCADNTKQILCDKLDEWAVLLYSEVDGEVVGTVRLNYLEGQAYPEHWNQIYRIPFFSKTFGERVSIISRMIVAKAWRGSTVSGLLLAALYRKGREMGSRLGFCNCVPSLLDFYEQIGFRRFAPGFIDENDSYRVPLVLVGDDLQHMKNVRSPLLRVARELEYSPGMHEWFTATFPSYATPVNARCLGPDAFWAQLSEQLAQSPAACVPLFDGMSDEETSTFLRAGTVLSLQPGDRVIRQGDVGEEMYVILTGVAEAVSRVGEQKYSLDVMDKGQVFGEVAFVSTTERSADVTALTDMKVLVISKGFLIRAMRKQPAVSAKVLLNLSLILAKRLRARTDSWVNAMKDRTHT